MLDENDNYYVRKSTGDTGDGFWVVTLSMEDVHALIALPYPEGRLRGSNPLP